MVRSERIIDVILEGKIGSLVECAIRRRMLDLDDSLRQEMEGLVDVDLLMVA